MSPSSLARSSRPARYLATAVLLPTTLILALVVQRLSTAGAVPEIAIDVDSSGRTYMGAQDCKNCHSHHANNIYMSGANDRSKWIGLDEFTKWQHDKHSSAYRELEGDLGKRMGELLGVADVTKEESCLSCHALPIEAVVRGDTQNIEDGVSCGACHGPAIDWLGPHTQTSWRTKSPEEKAKQGMRDLRQPLVQAELCSSCHIGDAQKKRVVTHEMYMAGHPPLPSLEVVTFANNLPRHWRYLDEKGPEAQAVLPEYTPGEHEKSKLLALSSVVNLRASMRLLSHQAAAVNDKGSWPKLEQFDCISCHHDLQSPSRDWRAALRNPVGPGMPDLPTWPRVMAQLALAPANQSSAAMEERLRELDKVLARRPFGDASAIPHAADAVAGQCDELLKALQDTKFDNEAVLKLLRALVTYGASQPVDYSTARQLAWAAKVLAEDLGASLPGKSDFDESLVRLTKALYLDLPAGKQESIAGSLPASLGAASAYHPDEFRLEMRRIAVLLAEKPTAVGTR